MFITQQQMRDLLQTNLPYYGNIGNMFRHKEIYTEHLRQTEHQVISQPSPCWRN